MPQQPRFPIAVLLLTSGASDTYRAVDSAHQFGLPVYVGVTGGCLDFGGKNDVWVSAIPWHNDFSAACRELQKTIDAEFILRLDSDEVLVSFPDLNWSEMEKDIFGVRLQESDLWTPRVLMRLYRNSPNIEWTGAIHETLKVRGKANLNNWTFLPSVVIRHYGYDDPDALRSKAARNMSIAKPRLDGGMPAYGELLTTARTEAYAGRSNPLLWLKCFKMPGSTYYGYGNDQRFEAAEMLCSCGYTGPARFLLRRNSLIIRLQIAMLAAQWRSSGKMDEERLDFLCECLSNGFHDPCYGFPKALLGADRQTTVEHIRNLANEWGANKRSLYEVSSSASWKWTPEKPKDWHCPLNSSNKNKTDLDLQAVSPIAVCILSHGNQEETERAVRSARRFGLPVYIGLTAGNLSLDQFEDVKIYPIPWQDDFAAARNRLLQYVDSEFVLWLDSDEVLFAFPAIDWSQLSGDVFRIFLQSYGERTPAAIPRLHRNKPGLSWHGRVHEIPCYSKTPYATDFKPLHSLIIRHYGYENTLQVRKKHKRNLRVAQLGVQGNAPSLGELFSLASWQATSGAFNILSWLRHYKKVDESVYYDVYSSKIVPAEMLCSGGYTRPAKQLVKKNPLVVRLQLAILANQIRFESRIDTERLSFVVRCLQNGYYYPFVDFPHKLLGANRENCLEYINQVREEWGGRPNATLDQMEVRMDSFEGRFRRIESFDSETFEDDLLVMHNDTRDTMVLNPAAAALWEALKWPQSMEDLVGLLGEAFPSENTDALRAQVEKVVGALIEKKLVVKA